MQRSMLPEMTVKLLYKTPYSALHQGLTSTFASSHLYVLDAVVECGLENGVAGEILRRGCESFQRLLNAWSLTRSRRIVPCWNESLFGWEPALVDTSGKQRMSQTRVNPLFSSEAS